LRITLDHYALVAFTGGVFMDDWKPLICVFLVAMILQLKLKGGE